MKTKNKGQAEEKEIVEKQSEETEVEEVVETDIQPEEEQDPLELLKEELASSQDNCLRVIAEYDNYRKRTQKEMTATYKNGVADTVREFLEVSDNLTRAKEASEASQSNTEEIQKGLSLISNLFQKAFDTLEVKEINPFHEPFNPEEHNAVMHVEDDSVEANTVVEVFQKGYKIGDRVLRYAMVKVAN